MTRATARPALVKHYVMFSALPTGCTALASIWDPKILLLTLTKFFRIMAKVTYSAGIDSVSGALAKPGKNPQHSCEKMLLATHRTAATQSSDCNRLYLRKKVKRTSPASVKEITARNRFRTVAQMVQTRKEDLMKVTQDQIDFLAQRDLANGKKTMKAYLWKVCGEEYDQSQD